MSDERRFRAIEQRLSRLSSMIEIPKPTYGAIYTQDGSTSQNATSTPVKVTGFAANGISANTTPDHTNDQITVTDAGIYLISFQCSFSGQASTGFQMHLRVDGVEQAEGFHRVIGTGGDVGSASFVAVKSLTAGQILTVYVEQTTGGTRAFTVADMQLAVVKIFYR